MTALTSQFALVEVSSDGNCLFGSVGKGDAARSKLQSNAALSTRELVQALSGVSEKSVASEYRARAISAMRARPELFVKSVKNDLKDALALVGHHITSQSRAHFDMCFHCVISRLL